MKTILVFKNSKVSLRMVRKKSRFTIQYFNIDTHRYHDFYYYHLNEYVACYQRFQLFVADNITRELFCNLKIMSNENYSMF